MLTTLDRPAAISSNVSRVLAAGNSGRRRRAAKTKLYQFSTGQTLL